MSDRAVILRKANWEREAGEEVFKEQLQEDRQMEVGVLSENSFK